MPLPQLSRISDIKPPKTIHNFSSSSSSSSSQSSQEGDRGRCHSSEVEIEATTQDGEVITCPKKI